MLLAVPALISQVVLISKQFAAADFFVCRCHLDLVCKWVRHCSKIEKGHGFESHPRMYACDFFNRARESTEYTVLTHTGL